jgi:hypothetical protein
MKIALSIYLFIHGIAHLVGFIVPWKITQLEEMSYKTTILNNLIDLKDTGIRIMGIFWLFLAIAFFVYAVLVIIDYYSVNHLVVLTIISLIFCVLGWPDAKMGILANILIFVFIFLNSKYNWIA